MIKIFNKTVGELTLDEFRDLLIYFGAVNKNDCLTFKLTPIKRKKK